MAFLMLNPSTADATQDDPTIRRCIGFARRMGAVELRVGNVYALRATNPRELWEHADPVGPQNDLFLDELARWATLIVAAWGNHAETERVWRVWGLLAPRRPDDVWCLGTTKSGAPRHPLYLRGSTPLQPWAPPL